MNKYVYTKAWDHLKWTKMLYYIKLKAHKMLLALLFFSNIILNLTESPDMNQMLLWEIFYVSQTGKCVLSVLLVSLCWNRKINVILVTFTFVKEHMSKKISNVALLTFEGATFNVTFLTLLLILVYPLTGFEAAMMY